MEGAGCFVEIVSELSRSEGNVLVLGNAQKEIKDNLNKLGCQVDYVEDVEKFNHVQNCHYNVVISCELFKKLEDKMIGSTLEKVLKCLKPGGRFAFCETCFDESGSKTNACVRGPSYYSSCLESVAIGSQGEGEPQMNYAFEITLSKLLQQTRKVFWLATKVKSLTRESFGFNTFQEFLNKRQYSYSGILKYERIFGDGFISTGGMDTTKEFVSLLELKTGDQVLDVGSGIGGGSFYMARNYNVHVTGVDLSPNIVAIAMDRMHAGNFKNVSFEVCDATKREFPEGTFDVIYSRDTILHIPDKQSLFSSFLKWLKPGGRLLISDYCCSAGEWSEGFARYVEQRGYFLLSVESYGELLEKVGFVRVKAEDRTDRFVEMLEKELERISDSKSAFLKDFSSDEYTNLVTGWKDKVKRCAEGYQKWGLFYAEKL